MKSSPSRRPVRPHSRRTASGTARRAPESRPCAREAAAARGVRRRCDRTGRAGSGPARRAISRSALVAATMRTPTDCGRTSPTGWISPLSRKRSSLGWMAGRGRRSRRGTACRARPRGSTPGNASIAPVNAPRRWPNSWLSTSSRGTAEQLNGTNGPRFCALCVVNQPRDDFLAGAGFAGDQDRQRRRRPAARRCARARSSAAIGTRCRRRPATTCAATASGLRLRVRCRRCG